MALQHHCRMRGFLEVGGQLCEGDCSIHDLDKYRCKLEQEKAQLPTALEEAEATLEMEENKVLCTQFELTQVRHEIDEFIF